MAGNRTKLSIRNAQVTLFFTLAFMLLNFFSRRYFLEGLGIEIQGLRSTLSAVLSSLSLAELGIGTAISVSLYKPLHDGDHKTISEIVSIQGWLYRYVALVMLAGAGVVACFFPRIFADMKAPIAYAYASLAIFMIGTVLTYTINYKAIVLSADQKGYLTGSVMQSVTIIKTLVQIVILKYTPEFYRYYLYLAVDLSVSVVGMYVLDYYTRREYPWLKIEISRGREFMRKHPSILVKTGQIFFQSLATNIMLNLTPLTIYWAAGLTMAGGYDNYKNISANLRAMTNIVFTNLGPGVGSLIAEGNKDKIYSFYWEIHSLKAYIALVTCFAFLAFADPLVALWLGPQYIIAFSGLLILVLIAYVDFCRGGTDNFLIGFGLFKDVWAPIAEAGINILVTIVLARLYSWQGALMGTFVSTLVIHYFWKPYFLFTQGFQRSGWDYWRSELKFPLVSWGLIFIGYWIIHEQLTPNYSTWWMFAYQVAILTLAFAVISFVAFYAMSEGFRNMSYRLWQLVVSRLGISRLRLPIK